MNEKLELTSIQGEKVILRPITLEDTALIVRWRNNPLVRRNFIFQESFSEEMHRKWMNSKVASGEVVQYIIEIKEHQKPVGSVYIRDIDYHHHSAEYGIFIGEDDARGLGIGTETAKLFVRHMFKMLGLHRIFLRVFEDNIQACNSYKKAGFIQEGIGRDMVQIDGQYKNVVFMSVLESEMV